MQISVIGHMNVYMDAFFLLHPAYIWAIWMCLYGWDCATYYIIAGNLVSKAASRKFKADMKIHLPYKNASEEIDKTKHLQQNC